MINAIRAEWTKLVTTRAVWITTVLFLVLSVGWSAGVSMLTSDGFEALSMITVSALTVGLMFLGLSVIMIQAITVVTSEYGQKLSSVTFIAMPVRWKVALAKLLVYMAFAAVLTFIGMVLVLWFGKLLAPDIMRDAFVPFSSSEGRRSLWVYPLMAAVMVLFAQGLGWILHSTSGGIAVGLIFYLGMDNLLTMIPRIGDKLGYYSPFTAMRNFLMKVGNPDAPWGDSVIANFYVFLVWGVVLWVLGVVYTSMKDA